MNATKPFVALSAAAVLLLAGCGGSSTQTSSPTIAQSEPDGTGLGDSSTAPSGSAATRDIANIDVCSLLSQEDAAATARAHGLAGAQTAGTGYTVTATPQTDTGIEPSASCKFTFGDEGAAGPEGAVVMQVQSAKGFAIYSGGTTVTGLGDEAYRGQGSTVVRVGDLMLLAGEDSFPDDFTVDLYRKMIPHLK